MGRYVKEDLVSEKGRKEGGRERKKEGARDEKKKKEEGGENCECGR